VLYFVRETRSTSPEAYAIFHVLRQGTTAQSTSCFKQSLNILNIILYFVLFYTTYMTGQPELYLLFKQRPQL